ncbi:MAG: hypothetical protein ABL903_07275 [Methylococcales bacterium]
MRFFKCASIWMLAILLQSQSPLVAAQSPASYYTQVSVYTKSDQFCLFQGEWSGDLSQTTLRYQLIVPPEDHTKHGDIFLGFRRKSAPEQLWLFGFRWDVNAIAAQPGWVQYDQKQVPLAYAMGQLLPAANTMHILDQPMNLTQFEGDGEVLVGYGLRDNDRSTTPKDSFKEMVDNNRLRTIWQVNGQLPKDFGSWTCLKFTEMSQKMDGLETNK